MNAIFNLQVKYDSKIVELYYAVSLKDYEKIIWNIMHQYYLVSREWYELLLLIKQMNKQEMMRNKIKNTLRTIEMRSQIEKKGKIMKISNEMKDVIENVKNTQRTIILKWNSNII